MTLMPDYCILNTVNCDFPYGEGLLQTIEVRDERVRVAFQYCPLAGFIGLLFLCQKPHHTERTRGSLDAFYDALGRNPIIAAIKTKDKLEKALASPVESIFVLGGNICELEDYVDSARATGKLLFIHMDLIDGIGKDFYAVKYLSERIHPDGIITTKSGFVKNAKEFGIYVIQRLFMLDSMSFDMGLKNLSSASGAPDALEILPGILPGVIHEFTTKTKYPIIAGGLIREKNDAIQSLKAGALGISTSCESLWYM